MGIRTPPEAVEYATTRLTTGYNGLCLAHVQDAYGATPVEPSAISAWNNSRHKHPTADLSSAPYGAPIYWSQPGNPYGHIALHLDDDRMYTTDSDAGHPHTASISDWQQRYGYQPLGWTEDIENQPIPGLGGTMSVQEVTEGLYTAKGNDGRNIFDSVIQTRNELKDRAVDALYQAKGNDGRNIFDGVIQARSDIAELKTMLTAQTAAIEALSKAMGADPEQIAQAVQQAVRDKLDSLEITITATDGTGQ